jgi:anti-sigma factor RsiW
MLLGGLLDGELDAANVASIEAHVARCSACRKELERQQELKRILENDGLRYAPPEHLKQRVIAALPEVDLRRHSLREQMVSWLAPAAGGALAASLAMVLLVHQPAESALEQQLVSSHVRSLQPGHLIDIQTSDRHVVKPWFNGKIDFAPPVPELADAGFPLAGGRLDSIDGKTVAAIVYHRRLHTVNLFVWPDDGGARRMIVDHGFAIAEWQENGLRFAAVSDIPVGDLDRFETAFRIKAAEGEPAK